ncbi:SDR family NAD(P)-dependent oxidoreductase [Enterococcus sp. LJL98]
MEDKEIAIIGLDISLPNADTKEDMWAFLQKKRVSSGGFPENRLKQIASPLRQTDTVKGSYFEHIDQFDHKYFKISKKAADYMDPNQRLSLVSTTKALENSGYLNKIKGTNTGVYASVNSTQQYQYFLLMQQFDLRPDLLGMLNSAIASRISYTFDLNGPAVMTDTACSSSLYSVTQACNDLRDHKVDTALAVSSNLYVKPGSQEEKLVDILSVDAKTKTFDARSSGTSMGEGVGTVVLKRLADAQRDGDYIYGVIRNYAANNDGRTMNMSAPNPLAQLDVLKQAWEPLKNELDQLAFIEAHGTGTAIGDTIEVEGLDSYFSNQSISRQSIALTACKANFGHLDVASGLLSLIKTTISLNRRQLVPHPDFQIPNEEISFEKSAFFIPDKEYDLKPGALAGVSSFGMTGTNVHVVLQEYENTTHQTTGSVGLNLQSYWLKVNRNSFEKKKNATVIDIDNELLVQYQLKLADVWEINEHKFQGKSLMVGTSFIEILAQGLTDTAYDLKAFELRNLSIANQLSIETEIFKLLLAIDKQTGAGQLFFSADDSWKAWVTFTLKEKERAISAERLLKEEALDEIEVVRVVGENPGEDIEISARWDTVEWLGIKPDRTAALVKLKVPSEHKEEFRNYHFYPALLDPAFNAINRTLEPSDVLFPWHWDAIHVSEVKLEGTEFYSEIFLTDKTKDKIGNIILTFDVRVFDENNQLILSCKDYKVKNAVMTKKWEIDHTFKTESYEQQNFPKVDRRASTLQIVHRSLKKELVARTDRVIYFEDLSELLSEPLLLEGIKEIDFWDQQNQNIEMLAERQYDLGQFLLKINAEGNIQTFNYLNKHIFSYKSRMNAGNRAIALGTYSLRLEVHFAIRLIDMDKSNAYLVDQAFAEEEFIVIRNGYSFIVRFKNQRISVTEKNKFENKEILIVGGSSGIGLAYTNYLTEKHPKVRVTIAGRKKRGSKDFEKENITYVQLDITDEESVKKFAAFQGEKFSYILNFAGEPAEGLFVKKSKKEFCRRTESKINGSIYLSNYFSEAHEIIHFSSLAGIIGAMGQTEYCLANAYQSGLTDEGSNIRSLNLTGWKDVGMSVGKEDLLFEKIQTNAGVQLVDAYVHSSLKTASMYTPKRRAEEYATILRKNTKIKTKNKATVKNNDTEKQVIEAWRNVLGEEDYCLKTSFFEQGGDSITIVQLCEALEKSFPNIFDVTTLFSIATIEKQVELINQKMKPEKKSKLKDISFDAKEMLDFLTK